MGQEKKKGNIYQKVMAGFIIAVLLLTFFSKSFYNYRLPVVTAVSPKQGELDFSAEGTGEVMYADISSYYAEKDGIIQDIFIEEGDKIKKGQLLMKIRQPDSNVENNVTALESGVVTSVGVKKGMYVSYMTNTVLYEAAKLSGVYEVILQISDDKAVNLEKGSRAVVRLPKENLSLEGEVVRVVPYADAAFTGYQAVVRFQSEDISVVGKSADVMIKKSSIMYDTLIPVSALRKDFEGYYVLVLQKNESILGDGYIAQKISVDLIDSDKLYCAVEGLLEDELVIAEAPKKVAKGDAVYYEGGEEEEEKE